MTNKKDRHCVGLFFVKTCFMSHYNYINWLYDFAKIQHS